MFAHTSDVRQEARALLLYTFRDKPRIVALIEALAEGAQAVEDSLSSLIEDSRFATCQGAALDQWGAIVAEDRTGLNDIEYRQIITCKILAISCRGDTDSMIELGQRLFARPGVTFRHRTAYPAASWFFAGPIDPEDAPTKQYIQRAGALFRVGKPAGVGTNGVLYRTGYFGFAEDPNASGYDVGVFAESF